jgi:hypothetical protein
MRLTIVPEDGVVCIDKICINGIDMSSIPSDVHAVQWYDTFGDVETVDPATGRPVNTTIYSVEPYQTVIDLWYAAHNSVNQEQTQP